MGSKRPVLVGESAPGSPLVKRSKTHQHPKESDHITPAERNDPCMPRSADSRVSLLRSLVREMVDEPDILPADPTIMQAISALNGAFSRSDGLSTFTANHALACQTQSRYHSLDSVDPGSHRRPSLPRILDETLEDAVFTHPACGKSHDATYDRLEILGDAYIELIATRVVWGRFPGVSSGRISQIRELLVKNETLADFAQVYAFDRRARVPANYSDQPKRWTKTKGDIFEAYVAAVILSRPVDGYHVAEEWLAELWLPKLASLGEQRTEMRSKEALAKEIMGKGIRLEYVEEQQAVEHRGNGTQTFFIGVYLTGWGWTKKHLGSGQGPSKVSAGDDAARNALSDTALISEIVAAKKLALAGG